MSNEGGYYSHRDTGIGEYGMNKKQEIIGIIETIAGKYNSYTVFCDWIKCCAIMVQNSLYPFFHDDVWEERENQWSETMRKYSPMEQQQFAKMFALLTEAMEEEMTDVLGQINQEQITGKLETAETATLDGEESTMGQPKSKLDCISRQQAIEALTGWETEPLDEDIVRTLNNLPPVTPTERTGEWVDREQCQVDEDAYDVAICSNCKAEITLEYSNDNYCPNCGAKMKGCTEND